jgi:molybdopterin biosynthesis enzyme MoaB
MTMGQLFQELCKGPVVVVDNRIGDESDLINKLIEEIKENALPVLEYTTIRDARNKLQGMLFRTLLFSIGK